MKVSVFDRSGRVVEARSLLAGRSGAVSLDLRALAAGIYLVRLDADGCTDTRKLVVNR
ncbi:MAG: T9SS type A sorting domain-containing protein [candidate division WOR-3 bacterium]|nr:MAG: T9SS type A sorting domain-containing protein [candidate division WOR-3 bacterium]